MRKLLLVVFVMAFSILSANADTIVRYNNAGSPISVQRGMRMPISTTRIPRCNRLRMGSGINSPAAAAVPVEFRRYGIYGPHNRPARPARPRPPRMNPYYYIPPVPQQTASVSRFDKSYSVNVPHKSHTMNGVTYYE